MLGFSWKDYKKPQKSQNRSFPNQDSNSWSPKHKSEFLTSTLWCLVYVVYNGIVWRAITVWEVSSYFYFLCWQQFEFWLPTAFVCSEIAIATICKTEDRCHLRFLITDCKFECPCSFHDIATCISEKIR